MSVLARIVSAVFHPLLATSWVFLIFSYIYKYSFGSVDIPKLGIMVLINTLFFPAFTIFLMWRLGFVPNLKMEEKQERIAPFFAVIICYVWAFLALKQIQAPGFLQLFVLGAIISTILAFIVNVFYRLNLHMVGMGSFIMLLLLFALVGHGLLINNILVGAVIVAGCVGSARMLQENSNLNELYFGLLVGFVGQMVSFVVFTSTDLGVL